MKAGIIFIGILVINCCLFCKSIAQIKATTHDGKKVILSLDGTWKYEIEEIERDSSLLKNLFAVKDSVAINNAAAANKWQAVNDSSALKNAAVTNTMPGIGDSLGNVPVTPPPPPPVVRKPPNLDCSALIAVERSIDKDRFVGVLKKLVVSQDAKTGFAISFYKTKHGPIIWTTNVMGSGMCIDEDTKMNLILKDGTTFKFGNEGGNNCEGNFKLYFGGTSGKEYAFEIIQQMDIRAIRIWSSKFSADQFFHEYDAAIFKSAMNCLLNLK